ncbi:UDP-4-amino-4,6-dideoxy-N-acetyl-beta-L-altrosamine N-acetyltransferase [Arcobacter sp. F155]|uniref:UDP-4-amino-4, 6-dideoxy-N-acetyl-beta-L-altrosamine N-acetyltransferase n=1 Tax=Arcobacter sp. F155 TaxID=2044512 RepID=UPI00100B6ACC|nr:UDP-4-amino-4,6-dideoxy-N-acetyl-beta-L-altrosamine N-acetyltransferase [Arcobacter sp. F155]RXJ77274.1 UDP-4-amino-4,6-dideoxy-N-acetyl-beta-L-altrosamine N-acetyltransferase [Arcobacter sp. F155]
MKKIKLINFTKLSLDEKKLILQWRNNPLIKKWMYTEKDISLEDHLSFIDNLLLSEDKLYFLVKENMEYIGVIDFVNISPDSLNMGIYANPFLKNKGIILLEEIIKYSFDILKVKKIKAEVFKENDKACNLYKKYNFTTVNEKNINNREVACMELINENR